MTVKKRQGFQQDQFAKYVLKYLYISHLVESFVYFPFFVFIMPRIFPGLHPGSADDSQSPGGGPVLKGEMNPTMRVIFYTSSVGFVMLYVWIYNIRVRVEKLTIKKLRSITV